MAQREAFARARDERVAPFRVVSDMQTALYRDAHRLPW